MIFISDKIEVRDSIKGGKGVFAKSNIPSGEIIEICHFTILEKRFPDLDKKLQEYVFSWPKNLWGGKSAVVWGFGSIYNHSKNNNADWETDETNLVFKFFTIKEIIIGEEICTNYGEAYEKVVKSVR
ncbi:MAG: SET domain-containing protein-lysine N-methyltransferase [Candidatus Kariarchaeum pelagius]